MTADGAARRQSLPAGGATAMRAMRDGWPLRTAIWPARDEAKGSILLLTGRGDFIEKYAETIHDLVDAGWGVAAFDWRGQGLSGRLGDSPEKGHATSFEPWLADLGEIIALCKAATPGPWFAIGHSMGGHLLLRRLVAGQNDFGRVVLVSPMLGMLAPPLGPRLARLLARLMVLLGRGGDYVARGGPRIKAEPGSDRQTLLTSDPERYADEAWWATREPCLSMGSATWGWLSAAFRSIALLFSRGALPGVRTTLLIMIPAIDRLVDNAATRRAQALIPGSVLEVVPCSGHELLRESSDTRARVLARITAFLMERP
ncbi:MAG: alpha/beta hydrolase [Sandarakinorhabdus sp.]|nr:alpha/beta hydrolase [Sandarakinorhabdus sp.]